MTTTITPEERAQWREKHTAVPEYYGHRIITLLNALEAAEVRAEKAEAERDVLMGYICTRPCEYCPVDAVNTWDCDTKNGPSTCQTIIRAWAAQEVARQAAGKEGGE